MKILVVRCAIGKELIKQVVSVSVELSMKKIFVNLFLVFFFGSLSFGQAKVVVYTDSTHQKSTELLNLEGDNYFIQCELLPKLISDLSNASYILKFEVIINDSIVPVKYVMEQVPFNGELGASNPFPWQSLDPSVIGFKLPVHGDFSLESFVKRNPSLHGPHDLRITLVGYRGANQVVLSKGVFTLFLP